MDIKLVALVRRKIHESGGSPVSLTSVDLVYPDGRDCGVPLFVEGYEGASELLMKFGVSSEKLEECRAQFEDHSELRLQLTVDEAIVRDMGFNPRDFYVRGS